jgi:hypothetical protein
MAVRNLSPPGGQDRIGFREDTDAEPLLLDPGAQAVVDEVRVAQFGKAPSDGQPEKVGRLAKGPHGDAGKFPI